MGRLAIVGIGCRYAGGIDSAESFWSFVAGRGDGVVEIPAERWNYRRFYDPDKRAAGRMYTKRAAFLQSDPWQFDADFFGMSAREGTSMDPQQRLVMEVAWEALDDAGMAGRVSGKSVGVYVGAFTWDHSLNAMGPTALAQLDMHTAGAASFTMLSNRLAYALNLTGPALTVDTACSSSLVAFHLASQAIYNGDCEMALVGGVNALLRPETFVMMCKGGFLAADGRCKSFSAAADGYGRGEGAGMVLLRKLDDALRDGDRIYAVVEATGSNQDGRTPAITVPSAASQEALARSVCARSGIAPHEVTYVEAHGTGTPVGDPVELGALGRVYGSGAGREKPLPVGSLKATLGHTEAASGIAGIIKAALAVHHRTLPPQGWFDTPNPEIPFEELGLAVQVEAEPVGSAVPRMAVAVNGFGYGGTNAHAIVAEPPSALAPSNRPPSRHVGVFPLSARSEAAAREFAGTYADLLQAGTDVDRLVEAAWTRRAHHRHRGGVAFSDPVDLAEQLRQISNGATPLGSVVPRSAGPVFVFTGMGPQWWAMGRDLLTAGGTFASAAAEIDGVFRSIAGWSVVEELLRSEDESRITSTAIAQPANFLIQVALTRELAEWGITPSAVVGHSVGEVSAAYVSGMLSLSDALLVAYHRARLQATTAGTGGMLAIGLPADEVRSLLGDDMAIDIAAMNSPSSVTVAGDVAQLQTLAETLTERGVFNRLLRVEVPYHSRRMDPILDELRTALSGLAPQQPTIPLFSSVTGSLVDSAGGLWDADYWCANVRDAVRFADTVKALVRSGHRVFLEVGPHPVLSANIREFLVTSGESGATVSTLDRDRPDADSVRRAVGGLYAAGALDVMALFGEPAPHLELPRYPWQRQRLHHEPPELRQYIYGTRDSYAMLGDPDFNNRLVWELQVSEQTLPWIADHVVDGRCILPGAAYLDAALSATSVHTGAASAAAEDLRFLAPVVVDPVDGAVMRTEVDVPSRRITIRSRPATSTVWTVNATGRLVEGTYLATKCSVPDTRDMVEIDPEDFYETMTAHGVAFGPHFRRVTALRMNSQQVVATVNAQLAPDEATHFVHPCVIDAALQTGGALIELAVGRSHGTLVPVGVDAVRLFGPLPEEVTVVARAHPTDRLRVDIQLVDSEGAACAQIVGMRCDSINPGRGPLDNLEPHFYEEVWDLRDPLDTAGLPPAEQTATLVVALGDRPHPRARELCDAVEHTGYYDWTGSRDHTVGSDADLAAGLRQQLLETAQDLPGLHVCVVVGDIVDDVAAAWALKNVATVIERFLEEDLVGRPAQTGTFGDETFYVTLVTERAFTHPTDESQPNPSHSALAGARRVLISEQPRLRWRLVDAEPQTSLGDLIAELAVPGAFSADRADELLLRSGLRWTPVVTRTLGQRLEAMEKVEELTDQEANFTVELPKSRILGDLGWRRRSRRSPGPGQLELQMLYVGMGYKDAVKALGLVGERELGETHFRAELGMEGIGVVTRVGPGVVDRQVGETLTTFARGMLTRYLITDAALCLPVLASDTQPFRPEHCTSSASFATAEYGLVKMAQLRPGETVLIHGAAGGVGSASIQVAKFCGAQVIGTASTDERRSYALAEGADHVIDSRSLNFVDDVREITNGRGADVVMTAAPLEILRHTFDAISEQSRIIEIAKPGIYAGGLLEMLLFEKNVTYFSIDLDRMIRYNLDEFVEAVTTVSRKFAEGTYRPLPVHVFPTADLSTATEEAFRSVRIGRMAVRLTDDAVPVKPDWPEFVVDPDGAYLITGGHGGFGLATGRWLVRRGVRHLILASRSGAKTDLARKQLALWRISGVEVSEELVDMTDADAVAALVNRCHTTDHPLRGIFHAAGAVADARVTELELDALKRVYESKVEGARALWSAVRAAGITLDQFVFYSSGGSMLGILGQYSYVAANMAVQSLAETIVRQGQPVTCIGWGHMAGSGGGMAADETAAKFLDAAGFDPIEMDDGPIYLEEALRLGVTQAAIIPINWTKLSGTAGHFHQVLRTAGVIAVAAEADSAEDRLRAALVTLDEGKRAEVVAYMLAEQLAVVMGVSAESIDIDVQVTELGLDSLMAVEFGARTSSALGVQLTSLPLGRSFDLRQAGAHIAEMILARKGPAG
jgi:acyl transferase domain-containing protein/NADPH:quinone reductase-like Zn-dependent oxidoreductase